ncbi:MAG: hypothetical protein LAO79_19890 [Acidobacteriia bacterium]|nr:hypothetical protein [Terriglobia bacterium]
MGSRTISIHLVKGIAGFALLAAALIYGAQLGWWALIPIAAALALLRG